MTEPQTERMTIDELRAKLDWEGGIGDLIEYGVDEDEVPEELASLWSQAMGYYRDFLEVADQIDEVLYA